MAGQHEDAVVAKESSHASQGARPKRRRRRWLLGSAILLLLLLPAGVVTLKIWQSFFISHDAPLIGASFDTAWHARAGISTKNYELALSRVDARFEELLPGEQSADEILDRIDGLLLTGGGDVDPALYGGDPESAELVDRARDDFELALIAGALERDMPILGICRGIQILNVAEGGTLRSLRDDEALSSSHGIGLDSMSAHRVTLATDSRLRVLLGKESLLVNSFHGQAVDAVGDGLKVVATSDDGIVEALELPGETFVVVTQWHPEVPRAQMEIWEAFRAEAQRYRQRKQR